MDKVDKAVQAMHSYLQLQSKWERDPVYRGIMGGLLGDNKSNNSNMKSEMKNTSGNKYQYSHTQQPPLPPSLPPPSSNSISSTKSTTSDLQTEDTVALLVGSRECREFMQHCIRTMDRYREALCRYFVQQCERIVKGGKEGSGGGSNVGKNGGKEGSMGDLKEAADTHNSTTNNNNNNNPTNNPTDNTEMEHQLWSYWKWFPWIGEHGVGLGWLVEFLVTHVLRRSVEEWRGRLERGMSRRCFFCYCVVWCGVC